MMYIFLLILHKLARPISFCLLSLATLADVFVATIEQSLFDKHEKEHLQGQNIFCPYFKNFHLLLKKMNQETLARSLLLRLSEKGVTKVNEMDNRNRLGLNS